MATIELELDTEEVRARWDELRAAGYGWGTALRLAREADVDLDLATDLLDRGCPPETALRILL